MPRRWRGSPVSATLCGWSIRARGGPAPDADDEQIACAWNRAPDAKQRRFDAHSARLVGATAAGLEALLGERQKGREPNREASQALVEQIRRELAQVSRLILA